MKNNIGLVIVDAERCFFPVEEGLRLGLPGFGELAVPGSEKVVEPINKLTRAMTLAKGLITYTLDKHTLGTAHFSIQPNYVNTWPVHGVDGTPGSEPHPELLIVTDPELAKPFEFIKGNIPAATPEDDDSYTGALAHIRGTKILLPEYLKVRGVETVYLAGLALGDGADNKLCVDSTAADLKKLGYDVALVKEAVEAVLPGNKVKAVRSLGHLGVRNLSLEQALAEVEFARMAKE